MKLFKFLLIGILFGIILIKSEVVSWFRIQEMFRFDSIHMYGVIGVAVILGIIGTLVIKRKDWKSVEGKPMDFTPKKMEIPRLLFGGILFGLGWAMTGACPGPIFAQIGTGVSVVIITLLSAITGTWVYGKFRDGLPA